MNAGRTGFTTGTCAAAAAKAATMILCGMTPPLQVEIGLPDGVRVVLPVEQASEPEDWNRLAASWLREHDVSGPTAMLVAGPSPRHPAANHRIEFMRLDQTGS